RWLRDQFASAKRGPESWCELPRDLHSGKDTPAEKTPVESIAASDRPVALPDAPGQAANRQLAGAPIHSAEPWPCAGGFSALPAVPVGRMASSGNRLRLAPVPERARRQNAGQTGLRLAPNYLARGNGQSSPIHPGREDQDR